MKIVISCCNRKNGEPFQHNGNTINFISRVNEVEGNSNNLYCHPDDIIPDDNITWRELVALQAVRDDLISAHDLYRPNIYSSLYDNYGNDLFIFSAGWGIIRAEYKLPKYNITFSNGHNIPAYAKRNNNDIFNDFNQLIAVNDNEPILFMAGKDYVVPFCELTEGIPNNKIIVYSSQAVLNNNPYLNNPAFQFSHYQTNTRTNWHYEFARRLINNEIEI